MKYSIIIFSICLLILSCKSETSNLNSLDLLEYGVPLKVNAPEGSKVVVDDLGVWKDITIKDEGDFNLQIIASQSTTFDRSKIVADQLKSVKESPYFSKILEEYDNGFIFEKKIDEENINYDFRYVKLNGDKEYIFQRGLLGTFSEQAVRTMYEAVQ